MNFYPYEAVTQEKNYTPSPAVVNDDGTFTAELPPGNT
jgi:hypothetical protein